MSMSRIPGTPTMMKAKVSTLLLAKPNQTTPVPSHPYDFLDVEKKYTWLESTAL